MKHKVKPVRHCERSEAIQSKWMAKSRFIMLGGVLASLVFPRPANAQINLADAADPCEGRFEKSLNHADLVFEGTITDIGLREIAHGKTQNKNFNKTIRWHLTQTYNVDKAWKGVSRKSKIDTIYWFPFVADRDHLPEAKSEMPETEKELKSKGSQIILLQNSKKGEGFYLMAGCDTRFYDKTAGNIAALKKKFPQGPTQ